MRHEAHLSRQGRGQIPSHLHQSLRRKSPKMSHKRFAAGSQNIQCMSRVLAVSAQKPGANYGATPKVHRRRRRSGTW